MSKVMLAIMGLVFSFAATTNAAIDETIRLKETIEINAPIEKVWAKIGNFGDMSWHPGIEKTVITNGKVSEVGATRVLTLKDGGFVNETLTSLDAQGTNFKYEITESVLPVREYGATIKLKSSGDGKTTVTWSAMFKRKDPANPGAKGQDDEAAKAAITGVLQSGLANAKKILE